MLTVEQLPKMTKTKQETFDFVVAHLRNQKAKSVNEKYRNYNNIHGCVYRSPEGLKCAAGCCIPDKLYHPKLEGRNISYLVQTYGTELIDYHNIIALNSLQPVHDLYPVEEWENELENVAKFLKVQYSKP